MLGIISNPEATKNPARKSRIKNWLLGLGSNQQPPG